MSKDNTSTPSSQSHKENHAYHVTYDCNEHNSVKEFADDWSGGKNYTVYGNGHINELFRDPKLGINKVMPYLWVYEIGTTGKEHYHCYFYSTKTRNTVKKYMFNHCKSQIKISDPFHDKYKVNNEDGVYGVEIYLHKGKKNHMCKNDDLKVMPSIISSNLEYYGDLKNKTSRSYKIRQKYEKIIKEMQNYSEQCRQISDERKLTEIQTILKDFEKSSTVTPAEIRNYLIDVHYMRPKYLYSENGFKRIFLKILKEKNPFQYKEIMRDRMLSICQNAFNL